MDNFNSVEKNDIIKFFAEALKRTSQLEKEVIGLKKQMQSVPLVLSPKNINAKTTGVTTLLTVPASNTLVITEIIIRSTAFTVGSKSIQAVINVGGNSAAFNDYLNAKTITISANNQYIRISPDNTLLLTYAAAINLSLNITTGSNATVENWTVELIGYYI